MKRSGILHRLIILFSLIVLPVIVLGIFIQWKTNLSMKNNILASVTARTEDAAIGINNKFSETTELAGSLLSKGRIKRIANPNDPMNVYERSVNVNFTRDMLTSIKLRNPAVNNIRLYLPDMNICYNADNVYDYRQKRTLGSQREMNEDLYLELLSFRNIPERIHLRDGSLAILQYAPGDSPDIIVETVYAPEELDSYFKGTLLYEDAIYLFTSGQPDYTLTNSTDDELTEAALQADRTEHLSTFRCREKLYYAFSFPLDELGFSYIQVISSEQLMMNLTGPARYVMVFTAAVLLCAALFVFGAFRIIQRPVYELSAAFQKIEARDFDTRVPNPAITDFQYLYESFNSMAEHLDILIQKELRHALLLQNAQLKQLQAQINPHFLYNSFFMLNQMVAREMNDSAKELTSDLGTYFQYITRNYQDEAALADEYRHALVYSRIQGRRFEGRISIEMLPLPENASAYHVPRLIFQPILENAFQYGVNQKIRDGLIRVSFFSGPDDLKVCFEDNGDSLADHTLQQLQNALAEIRTNTLEEETTGILNICKRLQLYYQRNDVMEIKRSELNGLLVTITLYKERHANVQTIDCR